MSNVESRAALGAARQVPHLILGAYGSTPSPAWGADQALGRTIERELLPRMLLAHRAGPLPPLERAARARHADRAAEPALGAEELRDFVERCLGDDDDAPHTLARELVGRGVAVEAICLDLLAPTAAALGTMWDEDACDFLEVTVALGRLQRVLRDLSTHFQSGPAATPPVGHLLLSSLPGEQHTLGLSMVAEFFVRDGWGVEVVAPASDEELTDLVRDTWFDVVGFSAACESRLLAVRRGIASVRRHAPNPNLIVVVGGRVFTEHPELVERVGADGYAASAADAPARCRQLLGRVCS